MHQKLNEYYGVELTEDSNMTLGEWLDFRYRQYCKMTIRPTTQTTYENRIYNHIIPEIGKIPLSKLTQNDLQQFYARLKKSVQHTRKATARRNEDRRQGRL